MSDVGTPPSNLTRARPRRRVPATTLLSGRAARRVRRDTPRPTPGRLRVAIVAESFVPDINGVTNSVLRVVEELTDRGHECLVIAPGPGPESVESTPVVRVRSFEPPRVGDLRVGLPTARMAGILRAFEPDVVHLAAPALLGAAGAIAARRLSIPSVAIYQTDLAAFARRRGLSVLQRPIWRWLSWVHGQADLTLAPSTATVWKLREQGVARVDRWARGVDLQAFHPQHRDRTLHADLAPRGEAVVGYVGRLAREKQVHRLVELARLDGVRLVVVGDGPERARLERELPGARFTGLLRGRQLSQAYATFDVFVHTGLDETFCQTIQEALASGVPVVAPASGGPLDLVQHGHNGYLWDPAANGSLAGAVRELAQSPGVRHRLGAAGRAGVEFRPWTALVDELLGHYATVSARAAHIEAAAA